MTFEASTLRHELRTPVNHIIGYADLLLEEGGLQPALGIALLEAKALAREALAAVGGILDTNDAVSRTTVAELDAVVRKLVARVAGLQAEREQEADVDRIRTGADRLAQLVEALQQDAEAAPATANAGASSQLAAGEAAIPLILVVDDDEANRNVLSRRLFRLGYRVVEASNGAEALTVLASGDIDVALLDIMMPGIDGYGVLERCKADPVLRHIPVIMISALDQIESVVKCIELGADDYLPKPFDPVLLKARVGACLEKKRLHDVEKALLATVSRQAAELQTWNLDLEQRVAEKVREVERLSLMQRFIPPQLADVISSGGADMLKSHRREITVLFCDLRGFTPFAEAAEPEDVMAVLSQLHNAVGPLIFEHGGTLAQFTGDGMMVFFNDPVPCDDPAAKAVLLALGMRDRAAELAVGWRRSGHDLQMGVGIAVGYATCGQVGFEGRFEYTAIGTVTNLASRLCAEAKGGQVLVSQRVFTLVEDRVNAEFVGELEFRGLGRPVPTYSLTGLKP